MCDINSYLLPKLNHFQLQNNSQLSLLCRFLWFVCVCARFILLLLCRRRRFFHLSPLLPIFHHLFFSESTEPQRTDADNVQFLTSAGDRHSLKCLTMALAHNKNGSDRSARYAWNLANYVCSPNAEFQWSKIIAVMKCRGMNLWCIDFKYLVGIPPEHNLCNQHCHLFYHFILWKFHAELEKIACKHY